MQGLYCTYDCVTACLSILADEANLKDLCWVPFDVKTLPIEAKGGILHLQPTSGELGGTNDITIYVEVPPDAVCVTNSVKMRYAVIPHGPFILPKGYQLGSMAVYIYYNGQHVTKPLILRLPHWYVGEDHTTDGLSFAVAPHSLKEGEREYHFQLIEGGDFSLHQQYGIYHINGHSSLFAEVIKEEATSDYLATQWDQQLASETYTRIAITYYSEVWLQVSNAIHHWWTHQ